MYTHLASQFFMYLSYRLSLYYLILSQFFDCYRLPLCNRSFIGVYLSYCHSSLRCAVIRLMHAHSVGMNNNAWIKWIHNERKWNAFNVSMIQNTLFLLSLMNWKMKRRNTLTYTPSKFDGRIRTAMCESHYKKMVQTIYATHTHNGTTPQPPPLRYSTFIIAFNRLKTIISHLNGD